MKVLLLLCALFALVVANRFGQNFGSWILNNFLLVPILGFIYSWIALIGNILALFGNYEWGITRSLNWYNSSWGLPANVLYPMVYTAAA